jgi:hypothetical protein
MSKETYYFSHDYNARTDEKIKLLIRKHGLRGYGIFWAIIEDLYNNANALRLDCEGIAFELREDIETIKSVIQDFDLFQIKDNYFGSLSVQERLNKRLSKSAKARETALLRWNKSEGNANAMQTHSEGNAIKESKVKEKKVKESNTIPSFIDFFEYVLSIDETNLKLEKPIKQKYDSWVANDWHDGNNNKITNWKLKIVNTLPYIKKDNPISAFKVNFPR